MCNFVQTINDVTRETVVLTQFPPVLRFIKKKKVGTTEKTCAIKYSEYIRATVAVYLQPWSYNAKRLESSDVSRVRYATFLFKRIFRAGAISVGTRDK